MAVSQTDLARILEQVNTGDISLRDAAQRLSWLETGQATTCSDCRFFRFNSCNQPNQPARPEHPDSIRCGSFEERPDERDLALPVQVSNWDRMK